MATGDHQAAAQAQSDSTGDITLRDIAGALSGQAAAQRKPSSPPPLSRVSTGPIAEGPYRVTPSLDAKNVSSIEGYGDHQGYVQVAFEAFDAAMTGLTNLGKAREQVKRDPSKTEAAQILLVAAEAERLEARVTSKFDHAFKTISKGIEHLEGQLNAPLVAKAESVIGRETREYARSLSADKRMAFIDDAFKHNDTSTLEALLGANAALSGLAREMQAHLVRRYREATQPQLASRLYP